MALGVCLALALAGCGSDKQSESNSVAPATLPTLSTLSNQLLPFVELATSWGPPSSLDVSPAASTLSLKDGARLTVPAGAFSAGNTISASLVKLDALRMGGDSSSSARLFALSTAKDTGGLASPVVLEIPRSGPEAVLAELVGGRWQRLPAPTGDPLRIEVRQFSEHIYGVFQGVGGFANSAMSLAETISAKVAQTSVGGYFLAKGDEEAHRNRVENGNDATKAFYGVGETTSRSHEEMCGEFQKVLSSASKLSLARPGNYTYADLTGFLFFASSPQDGGPLWDLTAASMPAIAKRVLEQDVSKSGRISPAAFLQISVEANNGNVPLGVLAAHNYLKDITYKGRKSETNPNNAGNVPKQFSEAMSKLETWRKDAAKNPTGEYDKGGPLYHVFAAMTTSVWGFGGMRQGAIGAEAVLRTAGLGDDVPDPEKGLADQCGSAIGNWIPANVKSGENLRRGQDQLAGDRHRRRARPLLGLLPQRRRRCER